MYRRNMRSSTIRGNSLYDSVWVSGANSRGWGHTFLRSKEKKIERTHYERWMGIIFSDTSYYSFWIFTYRISVRILF